MIRLLLIAEECDPEGISSPYIGYQFFLQLRRFCEVTLVTRERYRHNLEKLNLPETIHYIENQPGSQVYYNFLQDRIFPSLPNWGVRHAMKYPLYLEFNHKVYQRFGKEVRRGDFDLVHAITPIIPRYPYKISKACGKTAFVLGPVNGGISCPPEFEEVKREEYAYSGSLRAMAQYLPGYRATYETADTLLVGSQTTLEVLQGLFPKIKEKVELMPENGIPASSVVEKAAEQGDGPTKILFVGRLTPTKGLDLLIRALHQVEEEWSLTLAGEGPEREKLQALCEEFGLSERVRFAGWLDHQAVEEEYRNANLFCFPAIRESGGAVVLEAMAHGLPLVTFNHGGYMEYLDDSCALSLPLSSPGEMPAKLAEALSSLCRDRALRQQMGEASLQRIAPFTWEAKGEALEALYRRLLSTREREEFKERKDLGKTNNRQG